MRKEDVHKINKKLIRHVLPENWDLKFKKNDQGIEIILKKFNWENGWSPTPATVLVKKNEDAYILFYELIQSLERDGYGASEIYLER